jgi:hypothetical protein
MDLQPGDFVSYFGLASDAITSETTDIFFLEVEPFDLEYYQSQTAPGAGAAGQQSGLELAKQQKQVVVATFALIRDRAKYSEEEIKKNSQTIALIQQRLASQVQVIIERIERRGAASADPRFHKMIEYMNKALEHMGPAEAALNEVKLKDALPEEQKALQQLLRSEALFNEMQVSMAQNSGQGGASPEDLADLVDLELDRTKNQYETLQQSQQRQQDQALDEAAEKLKELAERQQQQLERQRKAQASSSSGGQPSQQELIEQAEELARQLARLSRQQQNEQLNRISRELNRAAREMRNSSQSGQNQQQSLQQAEQAMQRLKEAQKALAQHQQSQIREEFQKLREQAQQLNRNQEEVVERLSQLEQQSTGENLSEEFYQELRRLFWDKEDLQNDLQELEGNLHQSAKRLQGEEPEASRKLKEAGLAVRDNRLPEKMQEGSELLASGLINMARNREETVKEDFQQLTEKIREAEQALGAPGTETEQEKLRKALNEAGHLVEQLEALKQMAEAQQQEGQQRQQGQSGQQEGDQQSQQQGNQRGQQGQGQREGEQQEDSQRGQRTDSAESGQQQGGSQQQDGSDPSQSRQPGQRSQRGGQQNPQNARSAGGVSSSGIDPQRLNREWQERLREAAELPEMLRGNPELSQQASRLFRQMRQFDPSQIFDDQEEIVRLKAAVIDGLHQLELEISKALKDDSEGYLRPVNEDQVPPEFRTRVEDYYRRLAERQKP